jgi:hypothetical protein
MLQGFRWAIENDEWEARVNSIKPLFEEARIDLGKNIIDKELVEKVWNRIAPGLASKFDSPYSLPVIAPRPLYILNGEHNQYICMISLTTNKLTSFLGFHMQAQMILDVLLAD